MANYPPPHQNIFDLQSENDLSSLSSTDPSMNRISEHPPPFQSHPQSDLDMSTTVSQGSSTATTSPSMSGTVTGAEPSGSIPGQQQPGRKASDDKNKKPRKRTTRACDQCNQLRTKCDGMQPCAHCQELKITCEYLRVPQKRGKASQTYQESASRKAAAEKNVKKTQEQKESAEKDQVVDPKTHSITVAPPPPDAREGLTPLTHYQSYPTVQPVDSVDHRRDSSEPYLDVHQEAPLDMQFASIQHQHHQHQHQHQQHQPQQQQRRPSVGVNSSHGMQMFSPILDGSPGQLFAQSPGWFATENGIESNSTPPHQDQQAHATSAHNELYRTTAPMYAAHIPTTNLGSGEFFGSTTSTHRLRPDKHPHRLSKSTVQLRYTVLEPIVDALDEAHLSIRLAEDLLETYFTRPAHVLAYLVRKVSVLSEVSPRKTSPALLFAMLLVAAHDSDNPIVTGTPSSRQAMISRLTDLTISHLSACRNISAVGSLDEVIAYIQLGTVVSASEFKGSSLRWWGIAWALAKELKLNQENPELNAEVREEQRRTWWLLYAVDRHLGLCYNRPLTMLDSESNKLYQPEAEEVWQSDAPITPPEADSDRRELGICHMVTGQGLFGYFLPLMSILGMLIEVHHAEQNPLLPMKEICQQLKTKVRASLDQYATSLKNWNPMQQPQQQPYSNAWKDYALQLVHVFHILYSVSWDPIELLNQENLMNHPDIGKVTNHAVMAAKSIRRILTVDPDLTLMPFFFGVYLLQGSFVLLAIVDRVESEASPEVFAACETIVHAHEVCIATLNTEYQRNFRKVMRNTMSLLGNVNEKTTTPSSASSISPAAHGDSEKDDARRRRQDVLGLYRWIAGGHGLAV